MIPRKLKSRRPIAWLSALALVLFVDAANVDLKAFTDRFYHKICGGHLAPVLETLEYIHNETDAWLEITADDRVVLHVDKVEMGQGTFTAFATLVGEELEVAQVRLKAPGPASIQCATAGRTKMSTAA